MLYEADIWHPGILEALDRAFRDQWTVHDEMMRTLIVLVDVLRRDQIVLHGGDPPEPIEVPRPGEPPPAKSWAKQMRKLAGGGD